VQYGGVRRGADQPHIPEVDDHGRRRLGQRFRRRRVKPVPRHQAQLSASPHDDQPTERIPLQPYLQSVAIGDPARGEQIAGTVQQIAVV
jgi:hypothetical protein